MTCPVFCASSPRPVRQAGVFEPSPMKSTYQTRQEINDILTTLKPHQVRGFIKMFSVFSRDYPVEVIVEAIPDDQLDHALHHVQMTVKSNRNQSSHE